MLVLGKEDKFCPGCGNETHEKKDVNMSYMLSYSS